jgi:hypothetical protein
MVQQPTEQVKHLQDRPHDWADATDEEIVDALLNRVEFVCLRWMAFVERERPHCLRRSLLLFEDLGGYLAAPARRWLRGGRRR